ncbi:MAG: 5-oxoprolinase subunit PxpA [Idiomarina sp.]|nr:5-oxoprolinase subunit PxpA [Idiomarina sp.]
MTQATRLLLNADLGESFGAWQMGADAQVMPLIDCANIATGFHASDPVTMRRTVALAVKHKVQIGAHPAYPDKEGFGRRAMQCSPEEITAMLLFQLGALHAMCLAEGGQLAYVKPHGALYHDMMRNPKVFDAILDALQAWNTDLPLVVLATAEIAALQERAQRRGISLWPEAFADRAYLASGQLVPRDQPGAVLVTKAAILAQVDTLATTGQVVTQDGPRIQVPAVTLCVHGDNDEAVALIADIRARIDLANQARATAQGE